VLAVLALPPRPLATALMAASMRLTLGTLMGVALVTSAEKPTFELIFNNE